MRNFPNVATRCPNVTRRCPTLPKRLPSLFNVVRTHASSLNLRTFKTSRRCQATCLQRCNNVAQKLPDVVQRWYNLVISWATHHNVAQHYRVSSAPSTTLPHTTQTLPNVCQRCQTAAQRFSTLSEHVSGGSLLLNLRTFGTSHRTPPWSQVSWISHNTHMKRLLNSFQL